MLKWMLVFTLVPTVELYLLIQIGTWIGPLSTVALILVTGATGAWLAKREGLGVLSALRDDLQHGMPPATRLMEGALVVAGGLLLITPGVFTDLTGFLLVIPWTRRRIAPIALNWLSKRFLGPNTHIRFEGPGGPGPSGDPRPRSENLPFDHPVR